MRLNRRPVALLEPIEVQAGADVPKDILLGRQLGRRLVGIGVEVPPGDLAPQVAAVEELHLVWGATVHHGRVGDVVADDHDDVDVVGDGLYPCDVGH